MIGVLLYIGIGFVALSIFDGITGKIRRKWTASVLETQLQAMITNKAIAHLIFASVLLIFWPAVFYGALMKKGSKPNA